MKRRLVLVLVAVLAGGTGAVRAESGHEPGHEPGPEPGPVVEAVNADELLKALPVLTPVERKLKLLRRAQDQIVRGRGEAAEEQRHILGEMEALFDSPDYWRLFTPGDASAIAAYGLSGGRPDVVERAAQQESITARDRQLLQGVAYYARGLIAEAAGKLKDLTTEGYPALLAGQIAMVQGLVLDDGDYDRRVLLLDKAMNSVPGTMVEEAALRRLVVLAAVKGDAAVFVSAARRYGMRFGSSLYAQEFHDSLAVSISRLFGRGLDAAAADLVLAREPQSQRALIYVALARLGIAMGRTDLCLYGGRHALRLLSEQTPPARQALLYVLACRVVSGDTVAAAELADMTNTALNRDEAALLERARRMASAIAAPPQAAGAAVLDKGPGDELAALGATALAEAAAQLAKVTP